MKILKENCSWLRRVYLFLTVILVMLITYKWFGYAPFGKNSLAAMDADIQYLDFFAYYKDVLLGKNSIGYTFGKSLGGANIAVFAYYLASPLNLLVIFFDKSELHSFFDILVAIKLGIAAISMQFFVEKRFSIKKTDNKNKIISSFLALGYAFSQYFIAQSSNIMWLDGVYLLPLVLLGVYKLVQGKSGIWLSISVGVTILFNWYTGGINCLFSIIWFFYEMVLLWVSGYEKKAKSYLIIFIKYGYSMLMGVLLSAVLFLPTIGAMKSNAKGTLNIEELKDITFAGNIGSIIQAYSLGSTSVYGKVALFCGSIAIIGCISLFLSKKVIPKMKIIFGMFIIIMIALFYWKPMLLIFSLFRTAESYWYRYSYIGIFTIIFLAAYFYVNFMQEKESFIVLKSGCIMAIILVVMEYVNPVEGINRIQLSAIILVVMGTSLYLFYKNAIKIITIGCLGILVIGESIVEIKLEMDNYGISNVEHFKEYTVNEEKQIEQIKNHDGGIYRISQITTRDTRNYNITAHYNEALAYNYQSLSSYTSCPDDVARKFLESVGYRSEADCMNIINTSIIGADTLLGVKYILSPYEITGYEEIEELGVYNGKKVYENPYVLPLAFLYEPSNYQAITHSNNVFEYQNELYSKLIGRKVEVYKKVEYSCKSEKNNLLEYTLKIQDGNYAYFGNIEWDSNKQVRLNVNNKYETDYSCWLAPSIFYIPENSDDIYIYAYAKNIGKSTPMREQFYALDLDLLEEITRCMKKNEVGDLSLQNGKVSMEVNGDKKNSVFISVPYDSGWTIKINGKKVEAEVIADTFYSIPLCKGNNEIIMEFSILYKKEGCIVSLIGLIGIFIMYYLEKRTFIRK